MAITTDRAYRQTLSASIAYMKQGFEDLVSDNIVLWNVVRENGNYRSFDGPEIRHHLQIDLPQATWATAYDKIRISPVEMFNDAVFRPTAIYGAVSFSGSELRANEGSTRRIDLMSNYLEGAAQSMREQLEVGLFSNGTGFNGRQIIGLGAAVPIVTNTGTYGGISRTNAIWQTTTYDINTAFPDIGTQWDSTTIRPILSTILSRRSRGNRSADLLIMSEKPYLALEQSMVAHQRIVNQTRLGQLGFSALEFIGGGKRAEAVLASGLSTSMPAETVFGLESRSLYLYYRDSMNFDEVHDGDGARPINQDAIAQLIGWEGQFVVGNPLFTWRAYDSNPAA